MKSYQILHSKPEDLDTLCRLFDEAIAYQKRKGYPEYRSNERETVAALIGEKLHFKLVIEGEIACVFNLSYDDSIVWRERHTGNSIYLHRVITNQQFKGQQLFGKVLDWTLQRAREEGMQYVRLDTWADNPSLVNYYQHFGLKFVEYFTMPVRDDLSVNCWGNRVILLEISTD